MWSMGRTRLPFGADGQAFPFSCSPGNPRVSLATLDPQMSRGAPAGLGYEGLSSFHLSFACPQVLNRHYQAVCQVLG